MEPPDAVVVYKAFVAHDHPGNIHGHESVAVKQHCEGKRKQDGRDGNHVVQTVVLEVDFVEKPDEEQAATQSDPYSHGHFQQHTRDYHQVFFHS